MRTLFTIGFTLFCHALVFAQKDCGTTAYMERIYLTDPAVAQKKQSIDAFTRAYLNPALQREDNSPDPPQRITIPVVVHVLYNKPNENISDEQVKSQIVALNRDFGKLNEDIARVPEAFALLSADCEIRFELAKVDPDGRATSGITRRRTNKELWIDDDKMKSELTGGINPWNPDSYLNIWVCNLVSGLLGYASFPGTPPEKDGVVIRWSNFGTIGTLNGSFSQGRTSTHEVGHWLNLIHPWGDMNCGDDEVNDTPKQGSYNRGCPTYPKISTGCDNSPHGDMFMNFMDFVDDECMNMFTVGQKERMRSLFVQGGFRESITNSQALGEPWNHTPPPVNTNNLKTGSLLVFPNPVSAGSITLEASAEIELEGKVWSVYSSTGQLLLSEKITQNKPSMDITSLKPGIYFVRIGDKNQNLTTRFVKN